MRKSAVLRLALITLIPCLSFPFIARAQSQDPASPSVAEAARRAQLQKKKSQKPAIIVDDDTLKHTAPVSTSAPMSSTDAAPDSMAAPSGVQPPPADKPSDKPGDKADKLKALKKQLVDAQNDLELSQTDLVLQQDSYFSNPDYAHDKDGKSRLDAKQLDVTEKQQVVEKLKIKIAELEGPQNASTASRP